MNKLLIATAVMVSMAAVVMAGPTVRTPIADNPQGLITADYGGVDYSTGAFTSNAVTATLVLNSGYAQGVFYGVLFSTGDLTDYVDVYDSTSSNLIGGGAHIARLYNVARSSNVTGVYSTVASGESGPRRPIRFKRGLIWKASSASYNMITVLFYKERD